MYSRTIKLLENYRKNDIFPGYSVAFLDKEKVQTFVQGYTHDKEPLKDSLMYDLASLTKVFVTSFLLLQLLEKNQIDIDDKVSMYLPNMVEKELTIRHLVTHTSGLTGYIKNRHLLTGDSLVEALCRYQKSDTFGKVFYTDTNFVLAGKLVEAVYKKPIADVFDEQCIQKLALKNIGYGPFEACRCVPTEVLSERGIVHDPKARQLKRQCGSAGLFASLETVIALVRLYLNKGAYNGVGVLSEHSVEHLAKDWTETKCHTRSLGWQLQVYQGKTWIKHTGFTGTLVMFELETQKAMIFLSNRILTLQDTPLYNELRDLLIECYLEEVGNHE
ncbi:beta-lactamase family protein [Carnobacteriaceae bacterium zg-84]|uniref:serine hydrolase domain-containing protein n=1 Tax=Granulicatella sp. zg-84 TaxID=2678503 RepID=UPI0013C03F1D|nr:serine hydrolase domain-containing protein [Granulicatella sp. zg-84]NEW65877.1 serine hydrolase [Granulicatella sp. zg-84]QMI86414.1 beta-lactamase family protein [Carnobacteriaceae bacterium zg-84]